MAGTDDEQAQTKAILPFLQRADEISKLEPKVAYYCRMYAVDTGIQMKSRGPKFDGVLRALIAKLERDKPAAGLGDGDKEYCRNFAESIFARADKIDRAGRADKGTCLTFYAATIFIEILRQFGPLPEDLVDLQRYAAWKAADIRKALREGRQPTPGNGDAAPDDLLPGVPPHEMADIAPAGHVTRPDGQQPTSGGEEMGLDGLHINDTGGAPELQAPSLHPGHQYSDAVPPPQHGYDSMPSDNRPQQSHPSIPPALPPPSPPSAPSFEHGGAYQPPHQHPPPPSGASFGARSDANSEGGLPSAPSFTRSVSVASSADQQPAAHALAPRYAPGRRVLYDAFDESEPVRGTIAKVDWQDNKWLYTVALPKKIVRVHEHILAPEYRQGEWLMYHSPDGANTPATAVATDPTYWRPSYQIRLASGQQLSVTDDTLSPAQSQPQQSAQQPPSERAGPTFSSGQPAASPPGQSPSHQQHSFVPPHQPADANYPRFEAQPPPTRPAPLASPPRQPQQSPPPADTYTPAPGFSPALTAVTEAQKCAKYAVSSLGFEDVPTAVRYLQDALRLLTQPS